MNVLQFESLVIRYVEGSASDSDLSALRAFVSGSRDNRELFRARVRLRRAQRGLASREAAEAVLRKETLPSLAEFDQLTYAYLDGVAGRAQVLRLRDAIRASGDLRSRFQSRMRLHAAQTAYLRSCRQAGVTQVLRSLSAFAQRLGRVSAHLCLLLLIFVELRVTVPAEYSGLMYYVESAVGSVSEPEFPLSVSPDEPDASVSTGVFDGLPPPMPMPAALPEPGLDEASESDFAEA